MSKVLLTKFAPLLALALIAGSIHASSASSCRFTTSSAVLAQRVVTTSVSSQVSDYLYEKANWVFENATSSSYKHLHRPAKEQVTMNDDGGGCAATTDCSGFVSYVLHTVAPRQYLAVRRTQPDKPYPQAKTYTDFFAQLSPDTPFEGWVKVTDFRDLHKGDLIAWKKEQTEDNPSAHENTGHVMFVTAAPGAVQEDRVNGKAVRYIEVPVLDSSSVSHFPPEQLPPLAHQQQRDGLGKGSVRIIIGRDQTPIGYWEGTYWGEGGRNISGPTYTHEIQFARLVNQQARTPSGDRYM